ncbi:saccharopine dehydrogenase family protein [Hyphomicrobium sp.]|uniref:saccharopine dehydrogenase family protein n=1 Tax=Hyphomicrobium sp. TaxID=82 RepID=UPI002E37ABDD|nr:saccharopine dehydrogenase NADP-binding domain-containing protein [Hyphomicrobium sp.]HEX2840943.1 saccharopine dehydrogenase NADP-binding domain-containing protein [Hyphomicrobium sp.]
MIVGSTGAFGAKIAELLLRSDLFDLTLAGRTRAALDAQAKALTRATGRPTSSVALDASSVTATEIAATGANLVINASGPFQSGDYTLARSAIGAGCHYVDLADARAFVAGIKTLDAAARDAGVLVVSGASSVPGLSSAVVTHYRDAFAGLREIDIAISPGNSFDPGVATVASVLGGVGQPMRMLSNGTWRTVYGWQGLRRGSFGAAGRRWLGYVDVPDLDLLPAHVAGIQTVRFQAGLEVSAFHLGLWAASWLVRAGLVSSLASLAPRLLAVKRSLHRLGSDRGGMTVALRGLGRDGKPKSMTWILAARSGHGPYVPALVSVALAKRLASGLETRTGALPCHGLVPLADILAEAQGLDITCTTNKEPLPP